MTVDDVLKMVDRELSDLSFKMSRLSCCSEPAYLPLFHSHRALESLKQRIQGRIRSETYREPKLSDMY